MNFACIEMMKLMFVILVYDAIVHPLPSQLISEEISNQRSVSTRYEQI
jgi:hypothetical protein